MNYGSRLDKVAGVVTAAPEWFSVARVTLGPADPGGTCPVIHAQHQKFYRAGRDGPEEGTPGRGERTYLIVTGVCDPEISTDERTNHEGD